MYSYLLRLVIFLLLFPASIAAAHQNNQVRVVASFSILANITAEIAGDRAVVMALVGPDADAHSFEPSPKTIQAVAKADLVISNGMGFETWLPGVIQSSGFNGINVIASQGVQPRAMNNTDHGHDHVDTDPHAWQDLSNGLIYAQNIAKALIDVDPANTEYYSQNLKDYSVKIQSLDAELRALLQPLAALGAQAITAHDAFAYFSNAYGVKFLSVTGLASQAEPSAYEVARLVNLAKSYGNVGFFTEVGTNPRLIEQLAREAGVPAGGPLYADTLAKAKHPANSYLGMLRWNAQELLKVLSFSYD